MEHHRDLGPSWLKPFLSLHDQYFSECPVHAKRPQRNLFCVDCAVGPLCRSGRKQEHQDHSILQVRKHNNHYVVKTDDLERYLNLSEIRTFSYCCNKQSVNLAGNGNSNGGAAGASTVLNPVMLRIDEAKYACLHCCAVAPDANCYYCSISCKLSSVQKRLRDTGQIRRITRHNQQLIPSTETSTADLVPSSSALNQYKLNIIQTGPRRTEQLLLVPIASPYPKYCLPVPRSSLTLPVQALSLTFPSAEDKVTSNCCSAPNNTESE